MSANQSKKKLAKRLDILQYFNFENIWTFFFLTFITVSDIPSCYINEAFCLAHKKSPVMDSVNIS